MIKIERYLESFEEEYWNAVEKRIDVDCRSDIMESCIEFLPKDFFETGNITFKALILSPIDKLKEAEIYFNNQVNNKMQEKCFDLKSKNDSNINDLYIKIYNAYRNVANSQKNGVSMRVRIVNNTGLTVCPYCNRDYINSRDDDISGAELDHFFSKSKYPLFAVCLYNLIPVCGNCNRIKSNNLIDFASPFDNNIDWNKDVIFSYNARNLNGEKINIESSNESINNNISKMHIKEAYQIHEIEVLELLDKLECYNKTQNEEFQEVLGNCSLTSEEIKKAIFGEKISTEDMRRKPLAKMFSDLHKEYKIYY